MVIFMLLRFFGTNMSCPCNTFSKTNTRKGGKEIHLLNQIDTQPLRSEKNNNIRKYWSSRNERFYFNIIARSQGSFWVPRTEWHTGFAIKNQGCVATLNFLGHVGALGSHTDPSQDLQVKEVFGCPWRLYPNSGFWGQRQKRVTWLFCEWFLWT